jgi:hypothetical protein
MTNLSSLTTSQLNQIIAIREQIETLQSQIDSIAGGGEIPITSAKEAPTPAKRKYHMSAAHKRKLVKALAKARKIRWAKAKAAKKGKRGKRRLSAAGRAAIIAATKARWAKVKAAKKRDRRSSAATRAKLAAAAKARWAKARLEGKTRL